MKKSDAIKQKKKKQRAERNRQVKLSEARHGDYRRKYPSFTFDVPPHVPSEFADTVRSTLNGLRFNDRSLFSAAESSVYEMLKRRGPQGAAAHLFSLGVIPEGDDNYQLMRATLAIGELLYQRLLENERLQRYRQVCDTEFTYAYGNIQVLLRGLIERKTEYGSAYHSPLEPRLSINNRSLIVSFSTHAIERIRERAVIDPSTYAAAGDAFAYLHDLSIFRLCQLHSNEAPQLAVMFWEECDERFRSGGYAARILGARPATYDNLYYLMGYGPVVECDDLLVVKSFLTPGMLGTPEYERINAADDLSHAEREALRASFRTCESLREIETQGNLSGLIWAHRNGVPQVGEFSRSPYTGTLETLARVVKHVGGTDNRRISEVKNDLSRRKRD